MRLSTIDAAFWAVTSVGHLILLIVLLIRRRTVLFPYFTTLISVNLGKSLVLYIVFHFSSKAAYFYTYVGFLLVDLALQLSVAYEISLRLFGPIAGWDRSVLRRCRVLLLSGTLLSGCLTFLAHPQTQLPAQSALIKFDLFSAALVCSIFVGFVMLSTFAGIPWRAHAARISQGLAAYAVGDVIVESARACFGMNTTTNAFVALSRVRIALYLICLIYWIIGLWREAPSARILSCGMREQLLAIQSQAAADIEELEGRGER